MRDNGMQIRHAYDRRCRRGSPTVRRGRSREAHLPHHCTYLRGVRCGRPRAPPGRRRPRRVRGGAAVRRMALHAALAQLVVHFMADPVLGVAEMARVTRPGGIVAACVWDFENDRAPISTFWRAVRDLELDAPGEAHLAGARADTCLSSSPRRASSTSRAGSSRPTSITRRSASGGSRSRSVSGRRVRSRRRSRRRCSRPSGRGARCGVRCEVLRPPPPFEITAAAWAARGRVSPSASR